MIAVRGWPARCAAIAAGGAVCFAVLGASLVAAHPLGNFSVNHSHNLSLEPQLIVDRAIIDFAEIPTAQSAGQVDTDGNGAITPTEFADRGRVLCGELLQDLTLSVDAREVPFEATMTSFTHEPGQAGLPTGRLECRFEATVDLSVPRTISLVDSFEPNRVGWHEINALGNQVRLIESPVPPASNTDELRNYTLDLLDSPLDVRQVELSTVPGPAGTPQPRLDVTSNDDPSSLFSGGPIAGAVERVSDRFDELVGRRDLTLPVGLLAVALAMVLGASHALLPGHGKTVMAAYIAGRQGSSRDAVLVGATVTVTHTGGVLVIGLALTLSSSLAGESVLAWLGVASGSMIAALGAALFLGAARHRTIGHGHHHAFGHGHHHHHPRSIARRRVITSRELSDRDGPLRSPRITTRAGAGSTTTLVAPRTTTKIVVGRKPATAKVGTRTAPSAPERRAVSRRGLVGMGVAGGLVPSPSALIVLLSAIALGRTVFGVVLVIGYGLGMAITLTLAGLLLVRIRDRYQARERGRGASTLMRWWAKLAPYATATLVVVVGLSIAIRGAGTI